ncbi:hypothetical protein JGU66_17585 [Myxococcaceae bacterium JPH2]|nr:hypothetical protein [Myxococcaceae bacterium JPH2]
MQTFVDNSTEFTREVGRLARAWSDATTEMVAGSTQVLGDLAIDVAESFLGVGDYEEDTDYEHDHDEADEDYDYDEEPETRSEYEPDADYEAQPPPEGYRRRGYRGRAADIQREARVRGTDVANSFSRALRESSHILGRSLDRFYDSYDDDRPEQQGSETRSRSGRGRRYSVERRVRRGPPSGVVDAQGRPVESQSSTSVKVERSSHEKGPTST